MLESCLIHVLRALKGLLSTVMDLTITKCVEAQEKMHWAPALSIKLLRNDTQRCSTGVQHKGVTQRCNTAQG